MQITFATLKRIFTILLAVVYLVVSSGLIMELHHCMGKLAGSSVSFFGEQHNDKCDNCGMEDKQSGCCKDEVKTFKSSPDQVLAKAITVPQHAWVAVLPARIAFPQPVSLASTQELITPLPHGPPLPPDLPIYLRVRSLRI